jgi:hypothetical protein
MDPITTAIVAALPALATDALKSAYESLKAVIHRKWGDTAPITKAISALEDDPKSKAQVAVLEEKVGAVGATEDMEVVQALHRLVEQMKAHGVGSEAVSAIQFNMSGGVLQGVGVAQTVTVDTMNFGSIPKNK